MPRITYGGIFGQKVVAAMSQIENVKFTLARCKAVADAMTSGGTTPAALEGSAEFGVATGQGQTFYTDLANLVAAFNGIASGTLTDLDQG